MKNSTARKIARSTFLIPLRTMVIGFPASLDVSFKYKTLYPCFSKVEIVSLAYLFSFIFTVTWKLLPSSYSLLISSPFIYIASLFISSIDFPRSELTLFLLYTEAMERVKLLCPFLFSVRSRVLPDVFPYGNSCASDSGIYALPSSTKGDATIGCAAVGNTCIVLLFILSSRSVFPAVIKDCICAKVESEQHTIPS